MIMFKAVQALRLRVLLVAGLLAVTSSMAAAQGSAFATIDVSGAGTGAQQGTAITSIDTAGDVTGVYVDANNVIHGFVLPAGGVSSAFNVTGAGTGAYQGTFPISMDTTGNVTGYYITASTVAGLSYQPKVYHGFVRTASGTITSFDVAVAGATETKPIGINATSGVVGSYMTSDKIYHGFVRTTGGAITTFDEPNAGTVSTQNADGMGTAGIAINTAGTIAGRYVDATGMSHGFVLSGGSYTSFDAPGAAANSRTGCSGDGGGICKNFGTFPASINTEGDIAGFYSDANNVVHGFVRAAGGTFTTFDVPGANPATSSSSAFNPIYHGFGVSINDTGAIAGAYLDADGVGHGFLRATDGTFTSFDAPGAGTTGSYPGTFGFTINAAGTIAGVYTDNNSVFHGFLFTPALTATTTALTPAPTPNPSIYGEPVTLNATVSSTAGTPPNGEKVWFMSGTTQLGSAALTGGSASLTTTALPTGAYSVTAVYGGDLNFSGSTSTAVSQTVGKASSSTTLTSSLNPSTLGASVTLTATVSGQFGGVATGSVTFSNGSTSLGTVSLSGNSAGLTTTALPLGTNAITAVYSGDLNFAGSTSNTVSQVVDESDSLGYTYSVYDFLGSPTDGSMILGGVLDAQGNVYGITGYGGANTCYPGYPAPYGCGTIVKWDTTGKETVLHNFAGTDGLMPFGGIVLDGQGNLYGTTYAGGNLTCNSGEGCGTVYKLNLSTDTLTTLHNFSGTPDGSNLEEPLLLDAQGNLYGTTDSGGTNSNGTVFKVDSAGNETPIYSAPAGSEWAAELGSIDAQGNVYGTTRGGGADSQGSVFKIDSTNTFTTLYSFTGGADGGNPRGIKLDALGNLWGYTHSGSLFELTLSSDGSYRPSTVQRFAGAGPGLWPGGRVIDAQGNQYFTASTGGDLACDAATGCGTVYKIDTSNNTTVLHAFTGTNGDGTGPSGGLLQDTQGNLYGGTGGGSTACSAPGGNGALVTGCGTAFKLALPASIATTTTTLTSSQNPSVSGQTVTFTATVVASAGTMPDGETVTFMYGPILLGAGTLSGGTASFTTTALPLGTDSITVVYAGDPNFAGSQSNAVSQTVSATATAPAITWATPSAITYGTALSATQLNASSTVAGTFAYIPAAGTVLGAGSQTLSVTFTPTTTMDYATTTATVQLTVNQATPAITWAMPAAITYGTALSSTQLDATASVPGSFVYNPLAKTTPAVGSDTLSVTFTPTDTTDYTAATATVTLMVSGAANPVPVIGSLSPAFTDAGGAAFTLTVNGSGFISGSAAYWGTTALTTTYVSATQLTASVTAAEIASAGTTAVTVQTPTPGGGTSNSWQFEVDSASGTSTAPTFTSTTATVTAGSTASYPVALPSDVTSVTVSCLNLPTGASCSYSSGAVTIITTSATPAGTYQVTVVFAETVSGAATAGILLPILLLPLLFLRRRLARRGIWLTACLGLALLAAAAFCNGCGGSSSSTTPQTHQVASSAVVTLKVQ
jgi:uncharacterized repeat protein (TIGR03803 family)